MKVAIIGGGASGLTAAIAAARNGAHVTLFERNDKVGKKILVTGNGKCNISNTSLSEEYYYSEDRDFVVSAFEKFGLDDTISFFKGVGLLLTEKRGGIYPYSEQAASVLDALRFEALSIGVKFNTDCFVNQILCEKDNVYRVDFEKSIKEDAVNKNNKSKALKSIIVSTQKLKEHFDRVIISTGGKAAPKTGSDGNGYSLVKALGHSVTKVYPALIGLKCKGDFWKSVSGVRCSANIILVADGKQLASEMGELQITDYGVSGIPVFQISRIAAQAVSEKKKVCASIDFIPEISEEELIGECNFRLLLVSDRTKEQFFNGFFNKKLTAMFLRMLNLSPTEKVEKKDVEAMAALVKNFSVDIICDNGYEQAQVTAGGVPLTEINDRFESKLHQGLFLTGELLDVDGKCGGYNLQWAWTSGYIAGEAAAKC